MIEWRVSKKYNGYDNFISYNSIGVVSLKSYTMKKNDSTRKIGTSSCKTLYLKTKCDLHISIHTLYNIEIIIIYWFFTFLP